MADILVILIFLFVINLIAFIHEWGHFYPARKAGAKVIEFGFGLPPRIFGVYKENGKWVFVLGNKEVKTESTIFSVNWLPFGAFNNILSSRETGSDQSQGDQDFDSKPLLNRFLVISGGIIVNFLFAVLIFYFVLASQGFSSWQTVGIPGYSFPYGQQNVYPIVVGVTDDSPAQKAGLNQYDAIVSAEGQKLDSASGFINVLKSNQDKEIHLDIINVKTNATKTAIVIPDSKREPSKGLIGASLMEAVQINYNSNILTKIGSGFIHGANMFNYVGASLKYVFGTAFAKKDASIISENMAGPVALYAIVKMVAPEGAKELLNLTALISLLIAFTNLLPLPAMDGGRLVFLFYEAIFKKRIPAHIEYRINSIGLIFFLCLGVFLIFKDFFQFKNIILKK